MKNLYEVWKEKYGSKTLWKVQFPKGIMTFKTKKEATRISEEMKKSIWWAVNQRNCLRAVIDKKGVKNETKD